MKIPMKDVGDIVPEDFRLFPVWEFAVDMEELVESECVVRPVFDTPVRDMGNRILGTQVVLANGSRIWARIDNLCLDNPAENEHCIDIALFKNGKWFRMGRPTNFDYAAHGPAALARDMGLSLEEVFPIRYDVSAYCVGDPGVVRGTINGATQN